MTTKSGSEAPEMAMKPGWVSLVLDFWFGALKPDQWFKSDPALDAVIRSRFLAVFDAVERQLPVDVHRDGATALATVLLLDQFSRNMFRGTPRAFATDPLALTVAERGIEHGLDRQMTAVQRQFFYLPFEHSEDPVMHARSIALFTALGDAHALDYAHRHKMIIDRFGRYPHRNAILGRVSTPDEIAFLKTPGSSF